MGEALRSFSQTIAQLPSIEEGLLTAAATRIADSHDVLARKALALKLIEVHQPPMTHEVPARLRIAAWNLERCKYLEASAALLARAGVDICLLSEMDYGMARSGNHHTTRELADRLLAQFAFAVEFIELGLGNPQEEAALHGEVNSHGFHGNAIISRVNFENPSAVRLDDGGAWFSLDWHHPRIGGRNALAATIGEGRHKFVVVSTHLESRETPEGRAWQVQRLMHYLDTYARQKPIIVAGDFNTAALPEGRYDMDRHPYWFIHPERYEPLFRRSKWRGSNGYQRIGPTRHDVCYSMGARFPLGEGWTGFSSEAYAYPIRRLGRLSITRINLFRTMNSSPSMLSLTESIDLDLYDDEVP